MSDTPPSTPAPPREIKPPRSISMSMTEEPIKVEEEDNTIDDIREHLQPLYKSGELLGFAICDGDGEIFQNDTFLSHEGLQKAITAFRESGAQLAESGRAVHRMSVEMDDIILVYHGVKAGEGLFVLSSDCQLDQASTLIAALAE
ncbi:hypothetical protein [Oceaniferula spumae]